MEENTDIKFVDATSIMDRIEDIVPTTDSARRVVELVTKYGKPYVPGELSTDRRSAVTGSRVPTIVGENRWETSDTLFFKTVFAMSEPDNANIARGRRCEPLAIAAFKKQYQAKVFSVRFIRSARYPFMAGTFDILAIMPDGEGLVGEVKCPKYISAKVPPQYVGQIQTYLDVADLPRCAFIQFKEAFTTPVRNFRREDRVEVIFVDRDPTYLTRRMGLLWNFWIRLHAFREAVLPIADTAARVLQAVWRLHRETPTEHRRAMLKLKLLAISLRYERHLREGVYEAVVAEMNYNMFPAVAEAINTPAPAPEAMKTEQGEIRLVVCAPQ